MSFVMRKNVQLSNIMKQFKFRFIFCPFPEAFGLFINLNLECISAKSKMVLHISALEKQILVTLFWILINNINYVIEYAWALICDYNKCQGVCCLLVIIIVFAFCCCGHLIFALYHQERVHFTINFYSGACFHCVRTS